MYTAEELVWATQLAYCNFKMENTKKQNERRCRKFLDKCKRLHYTYAEKALVLAMLK